MKTVTKRRNFELSVQNADNTWSVRRKGFDTKKVNPVTFETIPYLVEEQIEQWKTYYQHISNSNKISMKIRVSIFEEEIITEITTYSSTDQYFDIVPEENS